MEGACADFNRNKTTKVWTTTSTHPGEDAGVEAGVAVVGGVEGPGDVAGLAEARLAEEGVGPRLAPLEGALREGAHLVGWVWVGRVMGLL